MELFEIVAFAVSIASLVLAVGAIWLSIVFFRMSSEASKATTEAAKGIDASVKRLENLFDKLYSDTFSMMKDTVSDMRKHIWNKPLGDIHEKPQSDINESLKKEIKEQVSQALREAGVTDEGKNRELSKKLETSLKEILQKTRKKTDSRVIDQILTTLSIVEPISFKELSRHFSSISEEELAGYIFPLREKGTITWNGPSNSLSDNTIISINKRNINKEDNNLVE